MANQIKAEVDVAWLAAHTDDPAVRVVEVDVSPAAYNAGHLPGAVFWNAYSDLRGADYRPVGNSDLADLLARSGIEAGTTLVFYGYGAALGYWLLTAHGHPDVRLLVGSRGLWEQAGHEWSTDVPEPANGSYVLSDADPERLAAREAVAAAIGDPVHVLLDVRAELEYAGERFWPSGAAADAGRAGHVPGAVSVPIDLVRADDDTIRPQADVRAALERAGVTPDRKVIVYCTIGNRASVAAYALRNLLGYPDVSVYYGSWAEWGKADDTPVEAEAQYATP